MAKSKTAKKMTSEVELYEPVSEWLKNLGYSVQGEVCDADVLGVLCTAGVESQSIRSDCGADVVSIAAAIELKLRFNLELLIQAADRLSYADIVYVAVPHTEKKKAVGARGLCSRLGIGILIVEGDLSVREVLPAKISVKDPSAEKVRKNKEKSRVLREFFARKLAVNRGGTRGRKITAYREKALAISFYMLRAGEASTKKLRESGVENPLKYLYNNPYGWFEPVRRGVYTLSDKGRAALNEYEEYKEILDTL